MCLLLQVGSSEPRRSSLRWVPAKGSLSRPERKSSESWRGSQRCTEEQGTLLALCSCTPTSNALMETSNKPPEIGTKTNTETYWIYSRDVVKDHLRWRKEGDGARFEILLKVMLPVTGRARARIQWWVPAFCWHHWRGIYSREVQRKWETRRCKGIRQLNRL